MNKFYVIVPGFLLTVFAWFHHAAEGDRVALERRREATRVEAQRIVDARKMETDRRTKVDTQQRVEERERQLREVADKKRTDQEAVVRKIEADAAVHAAEVARLESELAAVGNGIAEMRTKREAMERETFALSRDVEAKRVERRTAELEIQRATRMLIARLDESELAKPAAVPATGNR